MVFEWDEAKRLRTLLERGLDFREAAKFFDKRPLYTYPSSRAGEARFVSVGLIELRLIAIVWMERDGARRIISMRRARDAEERTYHALFG